ncbi:VOC family protein [Salinibacillus xinjiangensis]|uniref:VOC family protein n=1 Tax=Salinibacillus xinjiangensis TaxID=1229268 RepID=A0A6G1X899_9BACI|nr:VOC family protein [Salinibacillus xinjiangensis]MRG87231.1 VOC family protein [Salinibacillus xinjiangensis]
MSHLKQEVHAVFVHVTDLKKSAEWYSKLLELHFKEEEVQSPVYNMPLKSGAYMTLDDHAFDPSFEFTPSRHPAFNFMTSDLKAAYDWIKQEGIPVVRDIETHGNFGWIHIMDPDENVLMICGDVA